MKVKVIQQIQTNKGYIIPVGAIVNTYVERENPFKLWVEHDGHKLSISPGRAHFYLEGFIAFNEWDLWEAVTDGICPSLLGVDVEPDGWDPDGFPSILMASGVV